MTIMDANDNINAPDQSSESPFLTAPFKGKNAFWRYFVGIIGSFLAANLIGGLPLAAILITESLDGSPVPQKGGMPDFEAMGIDLNVGFLLNIFPFLLGLVVIIALIKPLHARSFPTVVNGGDPGNFRLNNTSNSLIILAVLALTLIPFQAAYEEILFRGYLMQGFAVLARNRWVPIIFTSVLFGLMHGLNPEVQQYGFMTMMPQYIFFGVVFAILTMFDGGIEMAIGAHAANNIFLSIMVTHDDMALQTPAMYEQIEIHPWKEFGGLIAMSVIFMAIMALIYRWKDLRKLYARIRVPEVTTDLSEAVDAG